MSLAKLWAIAWKELYTTFRDRNLILIMFATPLALSTIIGLAFGGLGGDTPTIAAIPLAVVNQDAGLDVDSLMANAVITDATTPTDTTFFSGAPTDFALNMGDIVASILLSEPITASNAISGSGINLGTGGLDCNLVTAESDSDDFQGSLDELLNATRLTDPALARRGVETGDYAVAVIIPPGFSQTLMPSFLLSTGLTDANAIEVYGNSGSSLSAGIVRSIVDGIASQFQRLPVTLDATIDALDETVDLDQIDTAVLTRTLNSLNAGTFSNTLISSSILTDSFSVLGCLFAAGINPITLAQQPLDQLQESDSFARILVVAGSAQAVFFALFTGVFGILSLYEERKGWTLQRMLVSPTSGNTILLGKLLGNLVVIVAQLLLLMVALSVVASIAQGSPVSIWGYNFGALLLVVVSVSLAVSGIGVLIVGLARTPEQVQIIGPMVNMTLACWAAHLALACPSHSPTCR
jgi:ABC-type Na+ efflux pump permease subunit